VVSQLNSTLLKTTVAGRQKDKHVNKGEQTVK